MPGVTSDTSKTIERKRWHRLKGNLMARYGMITEASHQLGLSVSTLRQASTPGKMPRARAKLKEAGLL